LGCQRKLEEGDLRHANRVVRPGELASVAVAGTKRFG
jgi:hypothetical protein